MVTFVHFSLSASEEKALASERKGERTQGGEMKGEMRVTVC